MRTLAAVLILTLAGSSAFAAAQDPWKQLSRDIWDVQAMIPANAQDSTSARYRAIFGILHHDARDRSPELDRVRGWFEQAKNAYFNELFAARHAEFNDDPARFQAFLQERLDLAVTLRKIAQTKHISISQAQLQSWRAALAQPSTGENGLAVVARQIGTGRIDHAQAVVFSSEYRPTQQAPEARLAAPPSLELVAATVKPQVSSLSSLISGVVGASKAYAQKVARAIFQSSAARDVDERLTAGIVWTESAFHSAVGSWAGCQGLGQLSEGVAAAYGVKDRADIAQNLKGTTGYLRDLLQQFTSHDDRAYVNGLFAQGAERVRRGADASTVFSQLWPNIPDGFKDAVASYNAGAGSVQRYGGWDKLPLPRAPSQKYAAPDPLVFLALKGQVDAAGRPLAEHCFNRPAQDNSYCQTIAYVPRVLKNYFTVFVATTPGAQAAPALASAAVRSPSES